MTQNISTGNSPETATMDTYTTPGAGEHNEQYRAQGEGVEDLDEEDLDEEDADLDEMDEEGEDDDAFEGGGSDGGSAGDGAAA